jgi:hypothetical protein
MAKEFGVANAEDLALKAYDLLDSGVSDAAYIGFLQDLSAPSVQAVKDFVSAQGSDPFGLVASGNTFLAKTASGDWKKAATEDGRNGSA